MERCWLIVWISMIYLTVGVLPQYRDKNISVADSDAVQALLARYLQRRLQGNSQISTPPPPSVIFSLAQQNQRSKSRQAAQNSDISPLNSLEQEDRNDRERNERRERRYEYDDYEDDLEGFEDSDKSRTRINLLAGKKTLTEEQLTEHCKRVEEGKGENTTGDSAFEREFMNMCSAMENHA